MQFFPFLTPHFDFAIFINYIQLFQSIKQVIVKPAAYKKNVETFVSPVPRSTASSSPNYFSKPKPLNYSKIREKNIEAKKRDVETSKGK